MNENTVPQDAVPVNPTDLMVVGTATPAPSAVERAVAPSVTERYAGAASEAVGGKDAEAMAALFPNDAYDILPTGEVYVSQVHYRRRLNEVFRPGGWALIPQGPIRKEGDILFREYHLLGPGGRFLAEAIGECEYQETNERMSYGDAAEGAKSNALSRCCKDLGIAAECWDRRWAARWMALNCVQVWRESQKKPQWRRKDAGSWWDEKGEVAPRGVPDPAQKAPPAVATAPPASAPAAPRPPTPPAPAAPSTGQQQRQAAPEKPYGGSEPKGNGRGRYGQPPCPTCGELIPVMKSKFGQGPGTTYYCNPRASRKAGCGNKWTVVEEPGTEG